MLADATFAQICPFVSIPQWLCAMPACEDSWVSLPHSMQGLPDTNLRNSYLDSQLRQCFLSAMSVCFVLASTLTYTKYVINA